MLQNCWTRGDGSVEETRSLMGGRAEDAREGESGSVEELGPTQTAVTWPAQLAA